MKKLLPFFAILLSVNAFGQWTTTNFSEAKTAVSAVAYGSKVWFGGGATNTGYTNRVETYDLVTEEWSLEQFSIPRVFVAAGAVGGKIFFAGGINFDNFEHYSRIDIFDTLTQAWTTAELSNPKLDVAAVSYGDQLFFAGGINLATGINDSTIDIYHANTGQWTKAFLSQAGAVRTAVSGSKLIFVGSFGSSAVDIYDAATETWTTESIPYARLFPAVTAVGDQVFIAGGLNFDNTPTDRVDIFDLTTNEWSIANLSTPRCFLNNAATACGKAFFAGGGSFDLNTLIWWPSPSSNQVDIFDPETGVWTTDQLSNAVVQSTVVSTGNSVLIAGGADSTVAVTTINIYACEGVGFSERHSSDASVSVRPNPTTGIVHVSVQAKITADFLLTVSDAFGRVVRRETVENQGNFEQTLDLSGFPAGVYLVILDHQTGSSSFKVVKQ